MGIQFAVFPLDWEEVFRTKKVDHQLQVPCVSVTRHAQARRDQFDNSTCLVDHVFYTSYHCFFGNRWRCNDVDQVSIFDFHIAVTTNRHLAQAVDRLTHPACFQNDQFMILETAHFFWLDQEFFISKRQFVQANGCADDVFHIKPCQDHSTASLSCSVKDLLDPRKVAGYRRHDHTTIPVCNRI